MVEKFKEQSLFRPGILLALLIAFVASTETASAHEWTLKVKGEVQKVEAKVVNFDGAKVLLEAKNGVQQAFPINELTDKDLEYFKNIVVARQTAVQEKLNLKTLQQERLRNQLTYRDIWEVQFYAPNGQYFRRQYLARNSQEATYQAHRDFPNARISGERKLRRDSRFGL